MESTAILICGAGPTGLMLAAQLVRLQADFILIDKKAAPTQESRAVVVQARSMEIYEQLGLSENILANSERADGLCFWRKGLQVGEVILKDFGENLTPFPFVTLYEQSRNETLLNDLLLSKGKEVLWNTELLAYTEDKGKYTAKLVRDGMAVSLTASYIIGCDGAHSKLRELAGMAFTGGTYEQVFYVADTHLSTPVCSNKINFFMAADTFNLFFPMKGEKRYRAIGILPKKFYHDNEISFETVSRQVNIDAGLNLGFFNTGWYSTYRLHHKKVMQFNHGNIFFCGDAAHVHSPAGGQGMNTGLQDAYNLGWKLALVANGMAKESLLQTYHEERNPVAESLLKTTDKMFTMMSGNSWFAVFFRMYMVPAIMPALMKIKSIRRSFFLQLSQTKIGYITSSISKGKAGKIKAGMRLPFIMVMEKNERLSLFGLLRRNEFSPFIFLIYNLPEIIVLPRNVIKSFRIETNSSNRNALTLAGFPSSFICLIRPDNYIAYISANMNNAELDNYLAGILAVASA